MTSIQASVRSSAPGASSVALCAVTRFANTNSSRAPNVRGSYLYVHCPGFSRVDVEYPAPTSHQDDFLPPLRWPFFEPPPAFLGCRCENGPEF